MRFLALLLLLPLTLVGAEGKPAKPEKEPKDNPAAQRKDMPESAAKAFAAGERFGKSARRLLELEKGTPDHERATEQMHADRSAYREASAVAMCDYFADPAVPKTIPGTSADISAANGELATALGRKQAGGAMWDAKHLTWGALGIAYGVHFGVPWMAELCGAQPKQLEAARANAQGAGAKPEKSAKGKDR
jgi:hypothetical protein